jgi:hypothetical protein
MEEVGTCDRAADPGRIPSPGGVRHARLSRDDLAMLACWADGFSAWTCF